MVKCYHPIMNSVIVGKDVSKDIDGKYVKYNPETFVKDVEPFDTIIYVGENQIMLKDIVLASRSLNKSFVYIGELDTEFVMRKRPSSKVYRSVKEYPTKAKATPIVEKPMVIEKPPLLDEDVVEESNDTSPPSFLNRFMSKEDGSL